MKIVIDIPEIPTNDKQRWALANGTPYPHGEWKEFTVSTYRGTDEWGEPKWGKGKKCICSRCGRRTVIRENFCPNCGSDNRKSGEAE